MSTSVFCPTCANLLLVEECEGGTGLRFCCATCPYVYNIDKTVTHVVPTHPKEVDDVLGGEEAWRNVDSTAARCPKCSHEKAFFMQVQIRSGDEPMTTFYKARTALHARTRKTRWLTRRLLRLRRLQCCGCKHQWREG